MRRDEQATKRERMGFKAKSPGPAKIWGHREQCALGEIQQPLNGPRKDWRELSGVLKSAGFPGKLDV